VADSDSMVRIEIGNGYAASYSLIWVIKTKIATWLISSQGERVQASQLPEQSWDRLKVAFDDAEVWSLHSAVDTAADDASTTFVSYCADDKSTQFAVYGLPTASEPTPSEHLFAEQVRGQRRVVRAVLD